jgi:hypothetical protein
MSPSRITNQINWNNTSSRITIFLLIENANIVHTIDYSTSLWPQNRDVKLINTTKVAETGQINLQGEFKNKNLLLSVTPFKLDLIFSPKDQLDLTSSISLQTMGLYAEAISDVNFLVESWLQQSSMPKIQRLAYAPELVSRVKSHHEAYEVISQYLPFPVDPATSSDFRYQINKFTTSRVQRGLKINRVTAWDVLRFNFQLSVGQIAQPPLQHEDLYYCHLSLDINTELEHTGELGRDKIIPLYKELVSHVEVISKEGIK